MERVHILSLSLILCIALFLPTNLSAQNEDTPADSIVSIDLIDGTTLKGSIVQQDEETISIVTISGLEIKVPRSSVVSIKPIRGRMEKGVFYRFDPNYSRLLFAPTGRPLRKGEGYFTDYWVLFPGVAYGFTDNLSIMAGFSVIPGLELQYQLKYVAPRIGIRASDEISLSAGALYISFGEGFAAGIAFGVATMGEQDKSFTAGAGLGFAKDEGGKFEFAEHPIIMLGGNARLSNSTALVSENWLILGRGFDLGEQPLALAWRFFGDKIAVDVGAIIILEILKEGFPIPWLSFVYNFSY